MLTKVGLEVIEAVLWLLWLILSYLKLRLSCFILILSTIWESWLEYTPHCQWGKLKSLFILLVHRSPFYTEKRLKVSPSGLGWKYKPLVSSSLVITKQVWNWVLIQSLVLFSRWLKSCSFLSYLRFGGKKLVMPLLRLANVVQRLNLRELRENRTPKLLISLLQAY